MKMFFFFILFFVGIQIHAQQETYFITTWTTNDDNNPNQSKIEIPTHPDETYNYDVSWKNDGVWETGFTDSASHDYGVPGTYIVAIRGNFPRIQFFMSFSNVQIRSIDQWGSIAWTSMKDAFRTARLLEYNATDAPNLASVTDLSGMFHNALKFNGAIGNWDVSTITTMYAMFHNAREFNQDIGDWDVSQVTDMSDMFRLAHAFNQDIGRWDVSNVTNMHSMFSSAYAFNKDIGDWDISNVISIGHLFYGAKSFNQDIGNWDVSNIKNMGGIFQGAFKFNQDISRWDVSKVNYMAYMFTAAKEFNQDIGNWDVGNVEVMDSMFNYALEFDQDLSNWNIEKVINMSNMFQDVTLSTSNYDAILMGWSTQNVQQNVSFHAGNSQYCEGADAREILRRTNGWYITDNGRNCTMNVNTNRLTEIILYPNPVEDFLYLNDVDPIKTISIINLLGQQVLKAPAAEKIDLSFLNQGVYIVELSDDTATTTQKIVKR